MCSKLTVEGRKSLLPWLLSSSFQMNPLICGRVSCSSLLFSLFSSNLVSPRKGRKIRGKLSCCCTFYPPFFGLSSRLNFLVPPSSLRNERDINFFLYFRCFLRRKRHCEKGGAHEARIKSVSKRRVGRPFFPFVVTCYQREPLPCTEKRKKESVVLDPPLLR